MLTEGTMLIVDDSKLARMMIREFVKTASPDLKIIEAANGDEALEMANDEQFTAMTIDYNMPGMNGLELAEKLKDSSPDAHISLLTANIQQAIQKRSKALGIEFIEKPVNEERILNFLNSAG